MRETENSARRRNITDSLKGSGASSKKDTAFQRDSQTRSLCEPHCFKESVILIPRTRTIHKIIDRPHSAFFQNFSNSLASSVACGYDKKRLPANGSRP